MMGTPVRSAAVTKPPRPNRCRVYRSRNGLPIPLKPSGKTPTSSPAVSNRSASSLQASVVPILRDIVPMNGSSKTRSAPSRRSRRRAGGSSGSATGVISASAGGVPEWLATTSPPPVVGTFFRPWLSTRNHFWKNGRSNGSRRWSVRSGSKPNSSVSYSPVMRRRTNSRPPASCSSQPGGVAGGTYWSSSSGRSGITRASGIAHRPETGSRRGRAQPLADGGRGVTGVLQHGPDARGHRGDQPRRDHRRHGTGVVGQRGLRRVAGCVTELLAQHGGVDHAPEVQEPHLLRRVVDEAEPPRQAADRAERGRGQRDLDAP